MSAGVPASSRIAMNEAIEMATTPRGEIHMRNSRSRVVMVEPRRSALGRDREGTNRWAEGPLSVCGKVKAIVACVDARRTAIRWGRAGACPNPFKTVGYHNHNGRDGLPKEKGKTRLRGPSGYRVVAVGGFEDEDINAEKDGCQEMVDHQRPAFV